MLDYGFEKIKTFRLAAPESMYFKIPVVGGHDCYVEAINKEGLSYTCAKENANITEQLVMDRFLFAPVAEGQTVGQMIYYNNGQEIGRIDLIAQNSVQKKVIKKKLFGLF
jgi:D-alanyl-D-alanine carboxypeptidase (penicillin-binding protein 5/6)